MRRQHLLMVPAGQRHAERRDAGVAGGLEIAALGRDDEHALAIGDVAQEQRQGPLRRAAEADDDDASAKTEVAGISRDVHGLARQQPVFPHERGRRPGQSLASACRSGAEPLRRAARMPGSSRRPFG